MIGAQMLATTAFLHISHTKKLLLFISSATLKLTNFSTVVARGHLEIIPALANFGTML
jgi:hypothetical protein